MGKPGDSGYVLGESISKVHFKLNQQVQVPALFSGDDTVPPIQTTIPMEGVQEHYSGGDNSTDSNWEEI